MAWRLGGLAAQTASPPSPVPVPIKLAMIEGLSGPFANAGEAVFRNLLWATERVNQGGGIQTAAGSRALQLVRYDSKGNNEDALSALRSAIDDGVQLVTQGNSSATAAVLIDAVNKHNERSPGRRVLYLNYSAVEPALTNEKCSFWHFRFDAHADMRLAALMQVLKEDEATRRIYLIGQDYSFGQNLLRSAREQIALTRPDLAIVGDELHPLGRVKDFAPYAAKIKASGAQAVLTGNWGNDLTLLVKAARDAGFDGRFYTFYGNALGVPATLGEAGVGKVMAVADWLPNVPEAASQAFTLAFRKRFPQAADDYIHMRLALMVQALVQSLEKSTQTAVLDGGLDIVALARALETASVSAHGRAGNMRASDHQFQQPLVVGMMDKLGSPGVPFDVEGSGFGFRVIKQLSAAQASLPTSCQMARPVAARTP
ncbi:MAG: branched-chain amino acid ABC transporter substrate-binding protein [Burkholderiaceae bacterium]